MVVFVVVRTANVNRGDCIYKVLVTGEVAVTLAALDNTFSSRKLEQNVSLLAFSSFQRITIVERNFLQWHPDDLRQQTTFKAHQVL